MDQAPIKLYPALPIMQLSGVIVLDPPCLVNSHALQAPVCDAGFPLICSLRAQAQITLMASSGIFPQTSQCSCRAQEYITDFTS